MIESRAAVVASESGPVHRRWRCQQVVVAPAAEWVDPRASGPRTEAVGEQDWTEGMRWSPRVTLPPCQVSRLCCWH